MNNTIPVYVESLTIGEPQIYKNMAVTPLLGVDTALEYLVLDEALEKGLTVKETGKVGQLIFNNNTGSEILILQGEYFKGGYQNRMVARNVYMAKDFNETIPVNCVQAGRWSTHIPQNFKGTGSRVSPKVYASAAIGQSAVWDRVRGLSMSLNAFSHTQDYDEVISQRNNNLQDYEGKFSCPENAIGIVITIQNNGAPEYVADIFSSNKTLKKNFQKLISASALEASISGNKISDLEIKKFLQNLDKAQFENRKAISLGEDYRITGSGIEGSGLIYDKTPLYVNISSKDTNTPNNLLSDIHNNNLHYPYNVRTSFMRYGF